WGGLILVGIVAVAGLRRLDTFTSGSQNMTGRWATPIDGQGRVLRPQGVPEGRPDRWGLTPPERLINWPDVKGVILQR
ncbi:hypothetical protein GR254_20215, partial [Mycobacterium tuberculosis]|nr:hypothetical protein [Mycobacterium tuberculosis]